MKGLYRAFFACFPTVTSQVEVCNLTSSPDNDIMARRIMEILQQAEKPGKIVQDQVNGLVSIASWTESLAQSLLGRIVSAVQDGRIVAGALKDAMIRATEAATEFSKEHPVYATIIAMGILAILLPWVIEALGFTELGPAAGSFAARWQSTYSGYVRSGSLFSYFQRLGMTWRHPITQAMIYPAGKAMWTAKL